MASVKPRSATPPPRTRSSGKGRASSASPLLTAAKRRELLEKRLEGTASWLDSRAAMNAELGDPRAATIDQGTAMIVRLNADDLVRTWSAAAEQNSFLARMVDQLLTGGLYGELFAVTLSTLIAVALVRGWIKPEQLPAPIRSLLPSSMFAPPPSEEVRNAEDQARQAATDNGEPKRPPPQQAESKPKAEEKKPRKK